MIKISIVTVCYNGAATIGHTIRSVMQQTHPSIEYIVVDGGSTDGTMEIVRKFLDRVDCVISESDDGIYDAMNKGWRAATGDVVGFLNADDVLAGPEVIAQIADIFATQRSVDAVYGDIDLVDGDGRTVRRWRSGKFNKIKYHWGWMTPHPTTYIRRGLFERLGGFRSDLRIAADYELMLRFFFKGNAKIAYLSSTLVKMTTGGASNRSVTAIVQANLEVYSSWKLNGLTTTPAIVFLKPLSKVFQLMARFR